MLQKNYLNKLVNQLNFDPISRTVPPANTRFHSQENSELCKLMKWSL